MIMATNRVRIPEIKGNTLIKYGVNSNSNEVMGDEKNTLGLEKIGAVQ